MQLGTQDKDFFPKNMIEKFRFIKEMGFECFEIDGKELVEHLEEVKQAIAETGLPVVTEKRLNGIEDLKKILHALKEVGGTGVVVPAAWGMFTFRLPPMVSPRSHEGDVRAIIDSLTELEKTAEETGTYLYLEPLNRYQDHMLNTQEDAVNIIRQGGFQRVKLTSDFYHMAIEEDDISETLKKYKDYIGHIHIAENHRYQPGTGSIDWKRHMAALKEIGYDGPVVNEGRIRGEDPLKVYQESVDFMKQFL